MCRATARVRRLSALSQLLLALVLALLPLWTRCGGTPPAGDGGDGGQGAVQLGRQTVAGQADLAAIGLTGTTKATVRSSAGEAPLGTDGAFSLTCYGGEGQLAVALSPAGNPMLLGWLDAEHTALSPRTTAEVLVYFASGAFALPVAAQAEAIEALRGLADLDALATSITAALAADLDAFAGASPVASEVSALVQQLANDAEAAARSGRDGLFSRGVLVNPAESRSGLALDTTAGLNSIRVANTYRRTSRCFVDRVSTFGSGGAETNSPAELTEFDVPSVTGLSTTVNTFVDIIWGRTAYAPVTTGAVELPLVEGTVKTRYRVLAVGPGGQAGDLSECSATERDAQQYATQVFVVKELFVPMVLNLLIPNSSLDDMMMHIGGADAVGSFITILSSNVPGVWEKAYAGDVKGAWADAYHAFASSGTFRDVVLQKLLDLIQDHLGLEAADKALSATTTILNALKYVDALLTVFDVGGIGYAIAHSSMADVWTVDVTEPKAVLTPAETALTNGATASFTVTVPELSGSGVNLVYHWNCTAKWGQVWDGIEGHQNDFDSSRHSVMYMAADEGEGKDTITVTVYALAGPSQSEREEVGTASAVVEVKERDSFLADTRGVLWGPVCFSDYPNNSVEAGGHVIAVWKGYDRWTKVIYHKSGEPDDGKEVELGPNDLVTKSDLLGQYRHANIWDLKDEEVAILLRSVLQVGYSHPAPCEEVMSMFASQYPDWQGAVTGSSMWTDALGWRVEVLE